MRKRALRSVIAAALVAVLGGLPAVASNAGWPEPFEPTALTLFDAPQGPESCGCLNELRACLLAAAVNLARCLDDARSPARETLCYLKAELDVVLCLERAAVCQLTCLP